MKFGNELNVLFGKNGAGKTTVLEAISIASLSKSFLPASDSSLVRNSQREYLVSVKAKNDLEIDYSVSVAYSIGAKKKISTNADDNLLPKDIIGEIPVVILSPDYKSITFGAPQDRRSFFDSILCQSGKLYMDYLFKLRKCIKQRNNLLAQAKKDKAYDLSELEPWTMLLIDLNVELVLRRNKFISEFIPYFNSAYEKIAGNSESVSIEYEPYGLSKNFDQDRIALKDQINVLAERVRKSEVNRGASLFGPQRDDLKISVNGGIAKDYASQGQHKSLLISLKLAEFEFLKEVRNETPIILLDDIFAELDDERSAKVLSIIQSSKAQTFITLTNPSRIRSFISNSSGSTIREIVNGMEKII